jgi:hypothetical protein
MQRSPLSKELLSSGSRCSGPSCSEPFGNEFALLAFDEIPASPGEGAQSFRTQRPHAVQSTSAHPNGPRLDSGASTLERFGFSPDQAQQLLDGLSTFFTRIHIEMKSKLSLFSDGSDRTHPRRSRVSRMLQMWAVSLGVRKAVLNSAHSDSGSQQETSTRRRAAHRRAKSPAGCCKLDANAVLPGAAAS